MADPKLWTILETIRDELAEIVGDGGATYWHTPGAVYIVREFDTDPRLWNTAINGGVIYAVRRSDRRIIEHATGDASTGGVLRAEVDIHILVSKWRNNASPATEPTEAELIEQMLRDVHRKLFFELKATLDGLVDNVADPDCEDTNQVFKAGWSAGLVDLRLIHQFSAATP